MRWSILPLILLSIACCSASLWAQTDEPNPDYFGHADPNYSAPATPNLSPGSRPASARPVGSGVVAPSPADVLFYETLAVAAQGLGLGKTPTVGDFSGGDFSDVDPYGALLVGFDVWTGDWYTHLIVRGITPIFQTAAGRIRGYKRGTGAGDPVTIEAKPGFAVAGLNAKGGLRLDGFEVIFMRVHQAGLDLEPIGAYRSEWVGGHGEEGKNPQYLFAGQKAVVGVYGGSGDEVGKIGLLYYDAPRQPKTAGVGSAVPATVSSSAPVPAAPAGLRPVNLSPFDAHFYQLVAAASQGSDLHKTISIGGTDGDGFSEVRPEGGVLVGFDVWVGSTPAPDYHPVIGGLTPIFQTPAGRVRGTKRGIGSGEPVTIEAKAGFAVAGVTAKAGARLDGFKVTFMRIHQLGFDLDDADAYASEWIGGQHGDKEEYLFPRQKIVTGIFGASNDQICKLGLLYCD